MLPTIFQSLRFRDLFRSIGLLPCSSCCFVSPKKPRTKNLNLYLLVTNLVTWDSKFFQYWYWEVICSSYKDAKSAQYWIEIAHPWIQTCDLFGTGRAPGAFQLCTGYILVTRPRPWGGGGWFLCLCPRKTRIREGLANAVAEVE